MSKVKCLVLVPRDAGGGELRHLVEEVLYKRAVVPMSLEKVNPGAQWVDQLLYEVRQCDFVVADVTNRRLNTLFELGVAHGVGKPFVLLVDVTADMFVLPSDLSGFPIVDYEPQDLVTFGTKLGRVLDLVVTRATRGR